MRIYWFYYKSLLWSALSFALFFSITSPMGVSLDYFSVKKFIILFATVGFGSAALLDSYFYKNKNYIYYNLGYNPWRLFAMGNVFNVLLAVLIWIFL